MVPAALLASQRAAGNASPAVTSSTGGTESPGTESPGIEPVSTVLGAGLPIVVSSPLQLAMREAVPMATTARSGRVARRQSMSAEPSNPPSVKSSETVLARLMIC